MERIQLISADKLKDISFIHKNMDEKDVSEIIWRCQEVSIQPILGTALYRKLQSDIDDLITNGTPIPTNYKILLEDYVWSCLVAYCEMRGTTNLNWKMREQAVGTNSDQFVRAGSKQETKDLQDTFQNDATHYRNLLISYIRANLDFFAEYLDRTNGNIFPEERNSSVDDSIMFLNMRICGCDPSERGYKIGDR